MGIHQSSPSGPHHSRGMVPLWVCLGVVLGWAFLLVLWLASTSIRTYDPPPERILVHEWEPPGPGVEHPNFYGAVVWWRVDSNTYVVEGRIMIGPGNGMFQELGELGRFQSFDAARQAFGSVTWNAAGVTIGTGANQVSVPRSSYENHR